MAQIYCIISMYSGNVIGSIIYNSKNHKKWQSAFTRKLRQDMIEQGADHAILSTAPFPVRCPANSPFRWRSSRGSWSGGRVGRVVEASGCPATFPQVVQRGTDRENRRNSFVTSDRCAHLFDQLGALTDHMLELDAKETSAHHSTWKRRGELVRAVQRFNGEFIAEVERIIGTTVEA